MATKPLLILASQSPRRKKLLTDAGYSFVVHPPEEDVEPPVTNEQPPEEQVRRSSFLKAQNVAGQTDKGIVLAADTVAECHGKVMGKPRDRDHARQMLETMSGQSHRVLTGVTLWAKPGDRYVTYCESTTLEMKPLPPDTLNEILDSGGWRGKAGGFGFQDDLDWLMIVEGLESNVVGLPVERLPGWLAALATKQ